MPEIRVLSPDATIRFDNDEALLTAAHDLLRDMSKGGAWIIQGGANITSRMLWIPNTALVDVVFDDFNFFDMALQNLLDEPEGDG